MKTKLNLLILVLMSITLNSFAETSDKNWKLLAKEDGIEILSKKAENGVLPFKATGIIKKDLESVFYSLMDYKNKNLWAPKLEKVKMHQKVSETEYIFSEYYKTPWPATDREFLLKGTVERINKNKINLKAHSVQNEKLKSNNHIQADVKYINIYLTKVAPGQTQIEFEFHGDMKGWMPLWLMNLIQKKWPLRFIQGLRKHGSERPMLAQKN